MNVNKRYPGFLIYMVGAMIILAFLGALVANQANKSRTQIPVWGEVPNFIFTAAYNEEPFGLEQLKGGLTVLNFGFTRCKGPCPIMMPNMAELYTRYKNSDKIRFVTVSVDPEHDSFSVLREYAERYGVTDNRWVFLRAPVEQVAELCEGGLMLAADELPMGHTTKFVLIDDLGQIRSYADGTDKSSIRLLEEKIKILARNI